MASLDLLILQKQKISKTGTLQHGISGVAILVDQHIDKKTAWSMSNSIASKIPEKSINNLKAFSSVKSEIQQNTHCLLTVSTCRISSTIFQKVRMAAFLHSFCRLSRLFDYSALVSRPTVICCQIFSIAKLLCGQPTKSGSMGTSIHRVYYACVDTDVWSWWQQILLFIGYL